MGATQWNRIRENLFVVGFKVAFRVYTRRHGFVNGSHRIMENCVNYDEMILVNVTTTT